MLLGMSVMILLSCDIGEKIPVNKKYRYMSVKYSTDPYYSTILEKVPTKGASITSVGDSFYLRVEGRDLIIRGDRPIHILYFN